MPGGRVSARAAASGTPLTSGGKDWGADGGGKTSGARGVGHLSEGNTTPPSFRLARQGYRLRTSGVAPPLYAARWRRALARALDSSGACGGSLTPLATDHPTDAGAVQQLQGQGRHFCPSRGNEGACRSTGVAVAGRHLAFWRLHGGELTDGNPQGGRVTPCGRPDSPPAWRPTAACSPSLWQRAVPFQAGHNARNAVRMVAITPIPARAASPAAPSLANGPQRDGGRARWGLPRPGGRKTPLRAVPTASPDLLTSPPHSPSPPLGHIPSPRRALDSFPPRSPPAVCVPPPATAAPCPVWGGVDGSPVGVRPSPPASRRRRTPFPHHGPDAGS